MLGLVYSNNKVRFRRVAVPSTTRAIKVGIIKAPSEMQKQKIVKVN